jgi:hypothetical protein
MNEIIPFSSLDAVAQSINPYPVDFDEAWQWVGYARKDSALRTLQENFAEGEEFSTILRKTSKGTKGGRPTEKYFLSLDCFKAFCMMAGTDRGFEALEGNFVEGQDFCLSKLISKKGMMSYPSGLALGGLPRLASLIASRTAGS